MLGKVYADLIPHRQVRLRKEGFLHSMCILKLGPSCPSVWQLLPGPLLPDPEATLGCTGSQRCQHVDTSWRCFLVNRTHWDPSLWVSLVETNPFACYECCLSERTSTGRAFFGDNFFLEQSLSKWPDMTSYLRTLKTFWASGFQQEGLLYGGRSLTKSERVESEA